jgi:hypothetical protein
MGRNHQQKGNGNGKDEAKFEIGGGHFIRMESDLDLFDLWCCVCEFIRPFYRGFIL